MLSASKTSMVKRHKASNGRVVRPSLDALVEFVDTSKEYDAACIIRKAWRWNFKFDLTRHRINRFMKLGLAQENVEAMRYLCSCFLYCCFYSDYWFASIQV
jgi:hypothetical protein